MPGRDPAELRLWWMTLARLVGLAVALSGLVLVDRAQGALPASGLGVALMLLGAAVTLLAPKWLNRRWRR